MGQTHEVIAPAVESDLTATFATQFLLEVLVEPSANSGRVDLGSIGPWFEDGAKVSLKAVPAGEFEFSHWIGLEPTNGNPAEVTMSAPRTVRAVFRPAPPVITGRFDQAGRFEVRFRGGPRKYQVEASEDLRSWEGLQIYVRPNGEVVHSDADSLATRRRFYRVVEVP